MASKDAIAKPVVNLRNSLPGKMIREKALTATPEKGGGKATIPPTKKTKSNKLYAGAPATILNPMLATLVDKPFDADGWQYEIKWDGYRAMADCRGSEVNLLSRNNKSFNEKFYPVLHSLVEANLNAVLDGEVIVADESGMANFGRLQNWRSEADGALLYYVFDILWLNGRDLTQLPLADRRTLLKSMMPSTPVILLSDNFNTSGLDFFAAAEKMGLEGIMAKRADSAYIPGARSKDWLKIKTALRHEVVIGGYTKNEDTAKQFSSLLVGTYRGKELQYMGKIGTGFNDKTQKEMMKMFKPIASSQSPFSAEPDINKPSRFRPDPPRATVTWLKPELVCEVSYRELTTEGIMRHPSFEGMRTDKPAAGVSRDKKEQTEDILHKNTPAQQDAYFKKPSVKGDATLLNPSDETQERKVNGNLIKFSNLSKIFWPKEKFTKRDLINYYYSVGEYMLPYLADRPQSLNRFPNGITGKSFYQKDMTGKVADWIKTVPYVSEGENKNFMLCNNVAALLYMANMGAIEMNPWSSTFKKPDNPDWCVIDLDPDKNHFDKVIETALVTHEILIAAGVDSYCKTSGSTGLHIYIPLGKKYNYEASKEFARLIAHLIHDRLPKFTSIERMTANRKGKLYIDFLQNRPQATLAAAYSVRPKPGATVSTPLYWDEVVKGMKMAAYNITNVYKRIKEMGDIFQPVLGKGIDMADALKKLHAMEG